MHSPSYEPSIWEAEQRKNWTRMSLTQKTMQQLKGARNKQVGCPHGENEHEVMYLERGRIGAQNHVEGLNLNVSGMGKELLIVHSFEYTNVQN